MHLLQLRLLLGHLLQQRLLRLCRLRLSRGHPRLESRLCRNQARLLLLDLHQLFLRRGQLRLLLRHLR